MDNQKALKAYRGTTMGAIHTLLVLFVFGMIANLYVEIPEDLTNHAAWSWVFSNSAVVVIHILLGTLLVLAAIVSLVMAFRVQRKALIFASLAGLVFTFLAYYFGTEFVSAGQTNLSSMLMALGFLGALVSFAVGILKTKQS